MRRLLLVLVAGLAVVAGLASLDGASASRLTVKPASLTPTMVATVALPAPPLSLALVNGSSNAGQAERGDKLVVTFPKALDASSLCSAWVASAKYVQTQSSNWAIVAEVVDGGTGNDTLVLNAPSACGGTIDLGTVDLGSTAFTTGGNLTFSGNGNGGRTTISYDPSSYEVTVVFGNRAGNGTAGTVGSVTATFTPSGALLYGDGTPVAPSIGTTTGVAL